MKTPICDFIENYESLRMTRLHMPGHKGFGDGAEGHDITEICGADSLYDAAGIIKESEDNASKLFGSPTYYSTEGSSHCIRAMLRLAMLQAKKEGRAPLVLASRNVHKAFVSAAVLLDFPIVWFYGKALSYLSCEIDLEELEKTVVEVRPTAFYITSPDYLGNTADIKSISEICHRHDVLLLVDNAHGAYLKFLENSLHPMDLGADICCDSAHKTLPVLTGGAYLHLSEEINESLKDEVKSSLSLFGSTSPSYLILQSLDRANKELSSSFKERLVQCVNSVKALKEKLINHGYDLVSDEPMKVTLCPGSFGYTGDAISEIMRREGIEAEMSDSDHIVFMLSPYNSSEDIERLESVLLSIERKEAVRLLSPASVKTDVKMTPRQASLLPSERIPVSDSIGRVLADCSVSCPPAVPIAVSGEVINDGVAEAFKYYGINSISVVAE